jgi:hypothetical protein
LSPIDPEIEINEIREIDTYMKAFNVHIKGNNRCEFCCALTLPWPSITDQEQVSPDAVRRILLV